MLVSSDQECPKVSLRQLLKREPEATLSRAQFETLLKIVHEECSDMLFPNSPMEVLVDETPDGENSVYYHLSVMSEGEWRESVFNLKQVKATLAGILKTDRDFWSIRTAAIRLIPDWSGWKKLNEPNLMKLIGESL